MPLRNRLEVSQKLKPPMTVKDCRSVTGMTIIFNLFCPELQKLLKPINDLTGNGRHFIWKKIQQQAFDEIKWRLVKLSV